MYKCLSARNLKEIVLFFCIFGLLACGDDSNAPAPVTEGNVEDSSTTPTPDVESSEEGGDEDAENAESPEGDDAAVEDTQEESDIQLVEVGCPNGQTSCLDKNGLNDPFLCAGEKRRFVPTDAVFPSSNAAKTTTVSNLQGILTWDAPTKDSIVDVTRTQGPASCLSVTQPPIALAKGCV